jgi:tyrosyl-tRNA synthetase
MRSSGSFWAEATRPCSGNNSYGGRRNGSGERSRRGETLALAQMDPELSTPAEAAAWLARDAVDALPQGELERKLGLGRPLRVKLGIDPTAPDIHLGHTVVLRKLREFQDLGHIVVLIIGDFTAKVGDPSGQSETRPILADEEIAANAQTFQEQSFRVLDSERVEVHNNSEWLDMPLDQLFALARTATVAQIIERDDFAKRLKAGTPVSVLELLYPLLQGYDSVAVKSDVELGGTDQKFNLLLARDVQRAFGVPEQVVLTMPILPGTDGVRRMSKSLANYIGVVEPPAEMFGKTLSAPDSALDTWYALLLGREAPEGLGPRDAKRQLALSLVERFHGADAARAAEEEFDRVHLQRQAPSDIPTVEWQASGGEVHLPALISSAFGVSSSDARRMLQQGGVRLDGEPVANGSLDLTASEVDGKVLQIGKRRFVRVKVG